MDKLLETIEGIFIFLFFTLMACALPYFPFCIFVVILILLFSYPKIKMSEEKEKKEYMKTLKELRDQANAPHERYIGPLIKKKNSIEL
jgi:uncharacterized protein YpmS